MLLDVYYAKRYGKIKYAALRKSERLYFGDTHAECFVQEPKGELRLAEQGFITEKGKFVNRKVALRIARYYKQIVHKHPPMNMLFSEDLMERG